MDPQTFSPSETTSVETATAAIYDQYVLKNYAVAPLALTKGEGSYVWDEKGHRYLDFTSGIAVCTLGHCHPAWVEAITYQANQLIHVSNLYRNQNQAMLAKKLVGEMGPGRMFFCNSGAEANEMLLKLSRLHGVKLSGEEGKRYKVITAENSFHGRTFGGMSLTPQEKVQKGFRPLLPGCETAKINDLESFEKVMDETTAAVLIEPIQGEGGLTSCSTEFLVGLRELCTRKGVLLLLDEIQCGFGRTGKFWAFEHYDIKPDILTSAKAMGGGMPIGAFISSLEIMSTLKRDPVLGHITTFGGHPVSAAASLATLNTIQEDGLLEEVDAKALAFREKLRHSKIKTIRNMGLMMAIEFDSFNQLKSIIDKGVSKGVLTDWFLFCDKAMRIAPPLTISMTEIEMACDILLESMDASV